jgi:hypothetical protein
MTRGEKFSMTASAPATRRLASSTPSGRPRSRVTDRLPTFTPWNSQLYSHGRWVPAGGPAAKRMPSGRWMDSTFTTSAPRAARKWAADGPAQKAVRSTIRIPSSGSAGSRGPGTRSGGAGTRWGGRGAAADRGDSRHGGRGWRNPAGLRRNTPRSAKWSMSAIDAPLPRGAMGMRNRLAVSTTELDDAEPREGRVRVGLRVDSADHLHQDDALAAR